MKIYKYIIIGDSYVGKSSILDRFINNRYVPSRSHTVAVEFGSYECTIGNEIIKLQFWDTAGQERFKAVTRTYYRNAVAAILVYDISRRSTYNHLTSWLTDARALCSDKCVILLVGNKSDLVNQREVSFEEALKFAKDNNMMFLETSAKKPAITLMRRL